MCGGPKPNATPPPALACGRANTNIGARDWNMRDAAGIDAA